MAQCYVTSNGEKFVMTTLRLPADLKTDLDDLARSRRMKVSSILIDFVEKIVEANRDRLEEYRKVIAMPTARLVWVRADEEAEDEVDEGEEDGEDDNAGD